MNSATTGLRPGDFVEVKTPDEILRTLDAEGAIDHLPFMPEMVEFCGRRSQVSRRVVTTCCYSGRAGSPRSFHTDDVVTLDGLRCSGSAHDGCQKGCMIFWRERWLRKVDSPSAPQTKVDSAARERLRARLKVTSRPQIYFCQASEVLKSTYFLASRNQKFGSYVREIRAGNFTAPQMVKIVCIWALWRLRMLLLGLYSRGRKGVLPDVTLGLKPGEFVEIKPMPQIRETLNEYGRNRGLFFSPDMRLFCGTRRRVVGRLDKIIVDGTGEMKQLQNTVHLDDSTCGCAYLGLGRGGCSRNEYVYWREIWLNRSN